MKKQEHRPSIGAFTPVKKSMTQILILIVCIPMYGIMAQGIVFEQTIADLGQLKQGEKKDFEYVYRNTGTETITLLQPRATCGCTAALVTDEKVAPGSKGKITASFTPFKAMQGAVEKSIEVYQQSGDDPELITTLRVRAFVVGDVVTDTGMLRFESTAGDRKTLRLTLTSNSTETLKLDNVTLSVLQYIDTTASQQYDASKVISRPLTDFTLAIPVTELKPGESTEVAIEIQTKQAGQMNGHLRIAFPNSELRIPVVGVVYHIRSPGMQ
jgi:hypothetical protein